MYQIYFYVPVKSKEIVKTAMFKAGAGQLGNYEQCCFESPGVGQFQPKTGSNPFTGKIGVLEKVQEYKVEMIVDSKCLNSVISALKLAHPYEEVAFGYFRINQ